MPGAMAEWVAATPASVGWTGPIKPSDAFTPGTEGPKNFPFGPKSAVRSARAGLIPSRRLDRKAFSNALVMNARSSIKHIQSREYHLSVRCRRRGD